MAQSEQSKCSATVLFPPAYVKRGEKYIGAILELSGTALIPFLMDLNAAKATLL